MVNFANVRCVNLHLLGTPDTQGKCHPDNYADGFTHIQCGLDLMADGACRSASLSGVEKGGVVAVHFIAGCPGGQSRKNVLAHGGVCVLIHHVNTN